MNSAPVPTTLPVAPRCEHCQYFEEQSARFHTDGYCHAPLNLPFWACPPGYDLTRGYYIASSNQGEHCSLFRLKTAPPPRGSPIKQAVPTTLRNCPTCESPAPHLHPAMQHEGEVQPCQDLWHNNKDHVSTKQS